MKLETLLGELKQLYRETAFASFSISYSLKADMWVINLTNKRKTFKAQIPEFALKEAITWIKQNRKESTSNRYSLIDNPKQ